MQYGDFRFALPDEFLRQGVPAQGTPVEVQLVMALDQMDSKRFGPRTSGSVRVLREVQHGMPRYQISGPIQRTESYKQDELLMAEWLVDAGLPVVIVAQGQSMGPEVRGGMWFDGAGTLWGDISWHDGAIFSPIRGTILRITERLPDPGSLRRDATIELTVDAKASPVRKLTWFSPDD